MSRVIPEYFHPSSLVVLPQYPGGRNHITPSYSVKTEFTNRTRLELAAIDRNNTMSFLNRHSVGAMNPNTELEILITHTYYRPVGGFFPWLDAVTHQLKTENPNSQRTSLLKGLQENISWAIEKNVTVFDFQFKLSITETQLRERPFMHESYSGVVFCQQKDIEGVIHPESFEYKGIYQSLTRNKFVTQASAGLLLEIVEHGVKLGDRYMYTPSGVMKVTIVNDPSRQEGLYVYSYENVSDNNPEPIVTFLTLEEAETKSYIFKTQEDAASKGNPAYIAQQQAVEAKLRLEQYQARHAEELKEIEKQSLRARQEYERLKHEQEQEAFRLRQQLEAEKRRQEQEDEDRKRAYQQEMLRLTQLQEEQKREYEQHVRRLEISENQLRLENQRAHLEAQQKLEAAKSENIQKAAEVKKELEELQARNAQRDAEHKEELRRLNLLREEDDRQARQRAMAAEETHREELRRRESDFLREKQERDNYYRERELRRNDYYESRSADRKDTSEVWKIVGSVVAGFSGAAALFWAMNKRSS